MKIIIVGAGTVGVNLAEHLSRQKNDVYVVDQDKAVCDDLVERFDVLAATGQGTSPRVLEGCGIRGTDMVIAVTPDDATNLLVCALARQYGVAKRLARLSSTEYSDNPDVSLEQLGVTDVIEPEKEIVRSILKYVELPGVTEAANFQFDTVYLRGYRISEEMPIANRMISEIGELHESGTVLIVLIVRNGMSIIPTGTEMVLPEDEIVAVMAAESLPEFRRLVNQPAGKLRKVVVSGDTLVCVELAQRLHDLAERVVLVDPDEEHGREAAAQLSKVEVIHGDCTRVETLQEVHVETASFFIAAGRDTEDNIMSCLLAKAEGAGEVIATGDARRHQKLFSSLGLDHLITAHDITLQSIIANVIREPIGALLTLRNAEVEVVRFVVGSRSRAVGRAIRDLDTLQREALIIGSVFRGDEVIIPSGDTVLQEGDEVLVVTQAGGSGSARRLFAGGLKPPK